MASNKSDLEHAYNLLTNKLRKLGYNLPIGIESTQLVDRLLTELINATQGYEKLHNNYKKIKTELEAEKKLLLPLRNENMKLVKENNDLHLEIIKLREEFERREISLSNSISKLDKEKQEIRFLIIQKDTHIKNTEIESENLRKKLNDITEKIYGKNKKNILNNTAAVNKVHYNDASVINFSSTNTIGKKQEINMPRGNIEPSDFEFPADVRKLFKEIEVNKQEWANDIKACDERSIKFRDDIKRIEEQNKNLNKKIEFLERQIGYREQEIKRISGSYSTGDNSEEIKAKYNNDLLNTQIEKLNSQIDFLNKENHNNEEIVKFHKSKCSNVDEIKKMEKLIINLKKENEKLKKENYENQNNNMNNTTKSSKYNEDNSNKIPLEEGLRLKKEISESNKKIKELTEINQLLNNENDKLKQVNTENNSYVNTDRAAMIKNFNSLKEEIKELKIQISESENKYDETNKQKENLQSELNLIKGREMLKNTDFMDNSENMNKFYKEYSELANENKNFRKKITDLESTNLSISKIQNSLVKENENFQKINSVLENKINYLEEELSKNKFISDNTCTSTQKLESQYVILENKYKSTLAENTNLNSILETKNNLLKDIELKNENYFNQIQNANDTIANLHIEYKNLSKEFTDVMNKNKRLEDKVKSYEKEFNENKFFKEKLIDYEDNVKSIKSEKQNLEATNKALKNELLKLNENLTMLKNQEEESKKIITILREDKQKFMKQLELNSNDMINLEEKVSNTDCLLNQIQEMKQKNQETQNKLLNKISEIEKLNSDLSISQFEIKKKNNEIIRLKEIIDQNKIEANAKNEENKFLKEQMENLKVQILEKKISDNSNISANLLELQEKYTVEKINLEKANYITKDLNEKLQKTTQERDNQQTKIANMTKLLAEADNTRAEMFSKIQQEINKSKFLENENLILKEKEQKNVADVLNLQDENKQLKTGISSLDHNYDVLNNELDIKTEEISKLNLIIKNLNDANDDISKKLSLQLSKCSTDTKRLSEREHEIKEIRIINSNIQKDNMELNAILQSKNIEVQEFTFEIKRISDENSHLQEQLLRLSQENEKLSLIKSQLEKNSDFIAQKYRSNELDMSELYNSYKEACKENERLKKNLQIFIDENKEAFNHIRNIENNLSNAMNNIQQQIIEKESMIKKIEMMEIFENEQNSEIERLRGKLENKISNEDRLKKNLELDQEINLNYENHNLKLQKQIAKLENEKKELEEIIHNLKNQIEYLNHLNKKKEFDMNNLELILVDERKKLHNLDCQNKKLKDEKEKLVSENNQLILMIEENTEIKIIKNKMNFNNNDFNNILNKNFNEEDNNVLRMLVNDLQSQLISIQNDLKTVREENTRLLSERSMSKNMLSDRMFSASSPSNKSDSRNGN